MNTINKLLVGASILGAVYLNGCTMNTESNGNNGNTAKETVIVNDGLVSIAKDSANTVQSASTGPIQLESTKQTWNNTKLIGKDEGFISYSVYPGDGEVGLTYVYSEYLFKNPQGEEITLFGKEGTLFIGQNYDIQFYKLKPNQNISSEMILDALGAKNSKVFQRTYPEDLIVGNNLEGVLNNYTLNQNKR